MKNEKWTLFLKKMVSGLFMGIGSILPGVSGGVMAVSFGLYRAIIDALSGIFKSFRKNVTFLFPIGVGMVIGVLATSSVVEWLMQHWRTPVLFLFIGLVLGGMPAVVKEGNKERGFKWRYVIATAAGACIVLLAAYFSQGAMEVQTTGDLDASMAIISGAILAMGMIIPGISASFILIYLGTYDAVMAAITGLKLVTLLFAGVGFICAGFILIKTLQKLFDKFSGICYYAVLGFAASSIVIIFPPVALDITILLNVFLFAAGVVLSFFIDKKSSMGKMRLEQKEV